MHADYFGIGTPVNGAEAMRWATKATEQDNAHAMLTLAALHAEGTRGFPVNLPAAARWAYRSATTEKGFPPFRTREAAIVNLRTLARMGVREAASFLERLTGE